MKIYFAAALVLASMAVAPMRADPTPAFGLPAGAQGFGTGDITLGSEFQVNSAIRVTDLGMFDWYANQGFAGVGLVGSHQIGLWTTQGTLLASATVQAGTVDPLDGFFRYVALGSDSVVLQAGDYVIGAEVNAGVNYAQNTTVSNLSSFVSYVQPELNNSTSGFHFPDHDGFPQDAGAYFGPNFKFQPVPDSGGLWFELIASGGLIWFGLAGKRRCLGRRV